MQLSNDTLPLLYKRLLMPFLQIPFMKHSAIPIF